MDPAKIIDADAHMSEPYDLWSKRIDRRFREEAPRVVENHNGRKGLYWVFEDVVQRINSDRPGAAQEMERPGGWDPAERVKDMAIDGIDATVLYSTRALTLYSSQNPELQEACFKVYNDWLAEFCGYAPERFAGLALIALWDAERGTKELERTRKLGLRGAQIWSSPPEYLPRYDEPAYDRFWAAAQDLNVPISLHLNTGGNKKGAYRSSDSYSYTYTRMVMAQSEVQTSLLSMIFSGLLSRFPRLRLVCAEGDIAWIPALLARADKYYASRMRRGHQFELEMTPSEYFKRNIWATFIKDPVGLRTYREGDWAERICWSTDYPHPACFFPHSLDILKQDFAGVPGEDMEKIVYKNVRTLYDFAI
jgi:predicted TIM-barrel fold metal-dependent hydrolase